jgi:hypothetical protein
MWNQRVAGGSQMALGVKDGLMGSYGLGVCEWPFMGTGGHGGHRWPLGVAVDLGGHR